MVISVAMFVVRIVMVVVVGDHASGDSRGHVIVMALVIVVVTAGGTVGSNHD